MDLTKLNVDPERLERAHRLLELCNIFVVACSALGITAWFTGHLVLFHVLGIFALILTLLYVWVPVFLGVSAFGEGKIVICTLFIVIGILLTDKFWAGLLLGGCFFGLYSMVPLAIELNKMKGQKAEPKAEPKAGQKDRMGQVVDAYKRLSEATASFNDSAEKLSKLVADSDLVKDYLTSGQWAKDFEAYNRGKIASSADGEVLFGDGLSNLMQEMSKMLDWLEKLQEGFGKDLKLEEK